MARAIVGAPLLAVVDEPLRGLDAFAQTIMREVLTDFRAHQGPAFLVITSDFTVAQALADDAFVFRDGKVVERGPIVRHFARTQGRRNARADRSGDFAGAFAESFARPRLRSRTAP